MLKKVLPIVVALFLIVTLSVGCSDNGSAQSNAGVAGTGDNTPGDSIQSDADTATVAGADTPIDSVRPEAGTTGTSGNTLSLDLTSLDPLVASDIAHRISDSIEEYLGMTIKLSGHYESAENYNTGGYIHGIVACNENLCCEAVIEFIWNGEHSYPEDYPQEYAQIELEGVVKSYEEAGQTYYYLAVDDIN